MKAMSATPLISGPTAGAVWLEGSPLENVVRAPARETFEIRPPLTGSSVLPVYGPIGGSTCVHWPTVESLPPRPPSATYRFPSGPHSRPRGLLKPVAKTEIVAGGPCFASLWPFTRAWAVAARAVRAARNETHKAIRLISLPSSCFSPARFWQSRAVAPNQESRAGRVKVLHEGEPFVIPNPWDAGSARVLETLGFQALATTSSGFAFTLGRADGTVTLDEIAAHVESLVGAVGVPVSVDLENGYGPAPEDAARAVTRAAEAGAVGGSIEDWDPDGHLYELPHAVERVAAAVEAVSGFGWKFTLTGRAENHIRGNPDLDDTIARLQAFEAAGADVLYAPGLTSADEIRQVCGAVSKPVNVLARRGLTFAEIVETGAQRISVGGSLTWTAVHALADAATAIRDRGSFEGLGDGSVVKDWLG